MSAGKRPTSRRRARGTPVSGSPNHRSRRSVSPAALPAGQLRCPVCRNGVTPTSTGYLRRHHDLFGHDCYNRRPPRGDAVIYTVRPLSDRTPFGGDQKPNPFSSTWASTLKLLEVELDLLEARDVVLEVDVPDTSQIRLDGMLRAHATVMSGAVRIAFESKHGPLTYATDRFYGQFFGSPPDWQINVRAIALGLESLRKIERYGIVKRNEQYLGFKQLGAGRAMPSSHMTSDQARDVITSIIGVVDRPWDVRFKLAKRYAHPDRHDGDRTEWDRLEEAGKVLGLIA